MMKSQTVFEFREKAAVPPSTIGYDGLSWESPRLSTAFPIDGQPAGSDRAICRTVNGFLQVSRLDKAYPLYIWVGLYGEYAGIPGLIQSRNIVLDNDQLPALVDFFRNANGVCFDQFITYSNLVERVFIRVFIQNSALAVTPVEISGVLIAADPTVS